MYKEIESGEKIGNYELKQLIGVCHGAHGVDFLGRLHPIKVEPSVGLQNILRNLPKGSKVGIEYNPDLAKKYVSKKYERDIIEFSPSIINYWQSVEKICQGNELNIVYLDDVELTLESACHSLEANYLYGCMASTRETIELLECGDEYMLDVYGADGAEELWSTMSEDDRKIYGHNVIADYILKVKREETIFKKITNESLDVAILGRAHANILAFNPVVKDYKNEIRRGNSNILTVGKPNFNDVLSQKLLTRRYKSITEGRMDPLEGIPDFIGYYNYNSYEYHSTAPDNGLFEVFFDKESKNNNSGKINGKIVDALGDAVFKGFFTDNSIEFVKKYDPKKSLLGAKGNIIYKCVKDGNRFVGKYTLFDEFSREVVLQKFDLEFGLLPKVDLSLLTNPSDYIII